MGRGFFSRLALNNIKRNQKKMLPYFIAATIMISVYFMVVTILFSPGLSNIPEHEALRSLFLVGFFVLNIFILSFMLYINSFLIKQRKKELGLYGILGLEKRHVSRLMLLENFIINGSAVILGIIAGCIFGWLIFMLLMKSIKVTFDSHYIIPKEAFLFTIVYFFIIFLLISIIGQFQVRMANPIDLLKSDHQGEKKTRFLIPMTILGLACMGYAYYIALTVTNPLTALNQFFIAVLLVIIGTNALFTSGSVFLLKSLKKKKSYYYKPQNFVSVAGMLHRMKQNASGLANICILSTMVLVTVSTSIALFIGQEDMLKDRFRDDIRIEAADNTTEDNLTKLEQYLHKTAEENQVKIEQEYRYFLRKFALVYKNMEFTATKTRYVSDQIDNILNINLITLKDFNRICKKKEELKDNQVILLSNPKFDDLKEFAVPGNETVYEVVSHVTDSLFTNGKNGEIKDEIFFVVKNNEIIRQIKAEYSSTSYSTILNIKCSQDDGYKFSEKLGTIDENMIKINNFSSIFATRMLYYSMYGGLLFMGAFFTILFLCATVLIIYFKQISEGYDDKERFEMLQKVGMDEREVKKTINKQILSVFFLPLIGALLHLSMASHMIIKLLGVFQLYNVKLTVFCLLGSSIIFILVYICVYQMTAKTYCRIVKW